MNATKSIIAVALASASLAVIAPAQAATTVDFDQSTSASTYLAQGLKLTGFTIGSDTFGGAVNIPTTPNYANADSSSATISFVDPTTGAATTSNGFGLTEVGLNGGNGYYNGATLTFLDTTGNVLGTQSFAPIGPNESRSPIIYSNNFANIATITFTLQQNQAGPGLFALDSVNFTTNAVTPVTGAVPEPATWAMMVLGFGMVGFGLRSRRKVTTKVSFG